MLKTMGQWNQAGGDRRGAIIVLAAFTMILVFAFVAFALDISYISLTKQQLQDTADSAALAGAMELSPTDDPSDVRANALGSIRDMTAKFKSGDGKSVRIDDDDVTFGKMTWNSTTKAYTYQWGNQYTPYNMLKVRAERGPGSGTNPDNELPLFFGPVLGKKKVTIAAEAAASFQPRDIMVVLDFSSSMNDDSCFGAISKFGRTAVENNLYKMWTELGSPVYGKLTFTPKHVTLPGRTASGTIPHIDVTYKRNAVSVVSTMGITQVRFQFTDSTTQTIAVSGNPLSGNYSASNSSKSISKVWVRSGGNASLSSGNNGEQFDITTANIKTALGLTGTYPNPAGSWDEYITTVQSSSGGIKDAGYRDMYGYMTWLEYLQTSYPAYSQSPNLWKTSEQPIGVLKDGVDEFVDYLINVDGTDKIGLAIYTHTNSAGAILEHGLSDNLAQVKTTTRQRQAGHYKSGTNISAGMKVARQEIIANARLRAFKMMVLMTDGLPNEPTNSTVARAAVITEANAAKDAKIKILTISLGAGADTSLMQQVADITGGTHFNIPAAFSIDAVREDLQNAFRVIASTRPLKLISDH